MWITAAWPDDGDAWPTRARPRRPRPRREESLVRRFMPMLIPVAALLLLGMPASALATAGTPSAGQDCTAQALPAGSAAAPVVTCYATFAQSIRAATTSRGSTPPTR